MKVVMRGIAVACSVFIVISCSSTSETSLLTQGTTSTQPDSSITDSQEPKSQVSKDISLEALAELACSDTPLRMNPDAELFTDESWTCTLSGEQVRIDRFIDSGQRDNAGKVTLEFYSTMGDNRTLADLPIICGSDWTIGVELNETRNSLIAQLNDVGITATTC